MKISKKSWHYTLVKFISNDVPQGLCSYFWHLVFAIAILISCFVGIPSIFGSVLIQTLEFDSVEDYTLTKFFLNLLTGYLMVSVLIGLLWFLLSVDFKWFKIKPNIFTEYVKSRKNKVCPRITYTDD